VTLASIPSPDTSVWHLGPFPLRAYALCIIAGVIAAVVLGERRLQARGGPKGAIMDIAGYAVPFGIVGARLYHVITSPAPYFGDGGHPIDALKIWEGGLGIWGGIAGGALGAWLAARRMGIPLRVIADVVAPGVVVAQALGRFGNWFNQELFGKPTDLPWGLKIDPGKAGTIAGEDTYHPTFLYESLWCLGVFAVLIWAERRFKLGRGRVFALYGMLYVLGRIWIEALRIDEANHILGLRLNIWTCLIVFAVGLWYFLTHPGPPEQLRVEEDGTVRVITDGTEPQPAAPSTEVTDEAADEPEPAEATPEPTAAEDSPEPTEAKPAEDKPAEDKVTKKP
jgi:prolipoprotein diacylglyceryl transferase